MSTKRREVPREPGSEAFATVMLQKETLLFLELADKDLHQWLIVSPRIVQSLWEVLSVIRKWVSEEERVQSFILFI